MALNIWLMGILALVFFLILYLIFKKEVKENSDRYALCLTVFAILLTFLVSMSELQEQRQQFTTQFQQQAKQYIIDNRPSVYTEWSNEVQTKSDGLVYKILLKNVGKLPAKIEEINVSTKIGEEKEEPIEHEDFKKLIYIFPEQNDMFIRIPMLKDKIERSLKESVLFKVKFDYYSITDKDEKNKFSYYKISKLTWTYVNETSVRLEPILKEIGVE